MNKGPWFEFNPVTGETRRIVKGEQPQTIGRFSPWADLCAAKMYERLNERIKDMEIRDRLAKEVGEILNKELRIAIVGDITNELFARISESLLAKFDIKEKPEEPSLLDLIEEARERCFMMNIKPASIYLGTREATKFMQEVKSFPLENTIHPSGVLEGCKYNGMTIYCLKTFTHLKVC